MPRLSLAAATHPGLVRVGNEDAHHAGAHLLAVADGVGGMSAGDRASRLVIETVAELDKPARFEEVETLLRTAVETANRRIAEELNADPSIVAAGTTLTALVFADSTRATPITSQSDSDCDGAEAVSKPGDPPPRPEPEPDANLVIAHVGDSRCYRLRDGRFVQLTKDDTFVQMLVDFGAISPEQAHDHPQRSVVTRVLRGEPVEVYYAELRADPEDRYLLCSDGLPAVVDEPTIAGILAAQPDPAVCVDQLIEAALAGGGPDNVTVVIADCQPTEKVVVPVAETAESA
jgi:protein phosphatase